MKALSNYRPSEIDFTVKTSEVPLNLGDFDNADAARIFMAENFVTLQAKHEVSRYMDGKEKQELRQEYGDKLEMELPSLRQVHGKTLRELETAKKNEKDAQKAVEVCLNDVEEIAGKVKTGTTSIKLDGEFTWEVGYNGKKYIYTYIDKQIKLADVVDIMDFEENNLLNSTDKNEKFFERAKKASNG